MTLCEMLKYGPIAACSNTFSLYVTVSSTELNLWLRTEIDSYELLNTTLIKEEQLSVQEMLIRAERVIEEYLLEVNEEIAREHYV